MARLASPVRTESAPAAAGQRTFRYDFDVDDPSQVVVERNGVVVPPADYEVGQGEVELAAGVVQAGDVVAVYRDTPTTRLTDFSSGAYARGPATEVGFQRVFHLIEEVVAEVSRVAQAAGTRNLPQSVTGLEVDLSSSPPVLRYTDSQGGQFTLPLPEPDFARGAVFQALQASVSDNTRALAGLVGPALRQTIAGLPDTNILTNARAARLDALRPWTLEPVPPLPSPAAVKGLYESNADTNAYTDADRARLAALPENLGDLLTDAELDARVGSVVGRVSAFFREAVIDGFFVKAEGDRVSKAYTADRIEVLSTVLVAGQVVGVEVAGYDDVAVATDRLLALAPERGTAFDGTGLSLTLTRDGAPAGVAMSLGHDASDRLLVSFDTAGAYNVLPVVYSSPAEVASAQIDARVASWARAAAADATPPTVQIPDANLPTAFPDKWGRTFTQAEIDALANARVAALVQSWARSATELIPSIRLARLTEDRLPADFTAPQSDWATTNNKPAWTGVFDGSYSSLTGRPVAYSRAQVISDLEGTPASQRLRFSALRGPFWANISDKPAFADVATSGSYTDLSNAPSLSGDSLAVRLRESGTETFPSSRVSGLPSVRADALSGASDSSRATELERLIDSSRAVRLLLAPAVRDILQELTGNDRLASTAIQGMLESNVATGISNATELGAIDTADGIHFAVIDTAFGDYAVDDFLIFNSATDEWVKVGSFADTVIPALRITRQGTGAVRMQLGTQAEIRINPANATRAGVFSRAQFLQQQRNTRSLAKLFVTAGSRRPLSGTGVDSFSGLDRLAIIRDVLDEFPFYESRMNRDVDGTETEFLTVPAFTGRERTYAEMQDAAGTTTRRVTGPANTNPASWGSVIFGFDYLEGGTRRIVPEFGEPSIGTARLDAGYGSQQGEVIFRTSGGAVLYAAANPFSELVALRFWATGQTDDEGHFRIRYLTGTLSAGAIVSAIPWRNLIQASVPAGLSTSTGDRRPVRKATAAESESPTVTDAVLTVSQPPPLSSSLVSRLIFS